MKSFLEAMAYSWKLRSVCLAPLDREYRAGKTTATWWWVTDETRSSGWRLERRIVKRRSTDR
jgi:hypothetical protein